MIKAVTTIDNLNLFKEQWNSLYYKIENISPFQQFEYFYYSIIYNKTFSDNLFILLVQDQVGNKLNAVFPFFLNKNGILSFINFTHTDFCSPLIDPNINHYNLYKELCDFINRDHKIKGLSLFNNTDSNYFSAFFKVFFPYYINHDINFYSTLEIYQKSTDKSPIDGFRYLNSKRKNYLKNISKKDSDDLKIKVIDQTSSEYPHKTVTSMVNHMLQFEGRSCQYFSKNMLDFWENLYNSGILYLVILEKADKPMACHLTFFDKKKNEYIMWILLYKDKKYNSVLYVLLEEYLYKKNKHSILNFARGIYSYKIMHFHPDVKQLSCTLIAKSRWQHCKNIFTTSLYYFKPVVKSFLKRK